MSNLATCSYTEFRPDMGVPIQSSNGKPKFHLRYALGPAWEGTMPDRWTLSMTDMDRFRAVYRRKLHKIGVTVLRAELDIIMERQDTDTAVLLCFEVLSKGKMCHRSLFAEWWHDQTGEDVPELGSHYVAPEPPPPGLF